MNGHHSYEEKQSKIAFLWDESFLWGLIAYDVFIQLSIDFDLVTAADIRSGCLSNYDIIFVPGGWASNKSKALGDDGKQNIRLLIKHGGSYLGFCGGAGLALSHRDGISLLPVSRKPTTERLPSFSGKIKLHHSLTGHPIWAGIKNATAFHAWWPGQFAIEDSDGITVLATYSDPDDFSYVADLPISKEMDWEKWEKYYKTNLNPNRINGEPAVIEGIYGKGKVLLSYPHFETPGDEQGHVVLKNMISYLSLSDKPAKNSYNILESAKKPGIAQSNSVHTDRNLIGIAKDIEKAAADLMLFGQQNFLWYWRNNWIIQWRRGVRGIEYCTIFSMMKRLSMLIQSIKADDSAKLAGDLTELKELSIPFFEKARKLLILERIAMGNGSINPLETNDESIKRAREELFSNMKSFSGYYKQILDRIDLMLLPLLIKNKSL